MIKLSILRNIFKTFVSVIIIAKSNVDMMGNVRFAIPNSHVRDNSRQESAPKNWFNHPNTTNNKTNSPRRVPASKCHGLKSYVLEGFDDLSKSLRARAVHDPQVSFHLSSNLSRV